jgi:hypothetical protein
VFGSRVLENSVAAKERKKELIMKAGIQERIFLGFLLS